MKNMDDRIAIERRLMELGKRTYTPISGSIELLPLCNMDCSMCYIRLSPEEMKEKGRMRTADEWLALAKEMKQAGTLFLLLTGGEPLIYPEFKRLYLALKDMGMILTVNTNATLIDEEWAAFFGAHKPRRVNVTIYGSDDETYERLCHFPFGFSKTIEGVQLLRKHDVDVRAAVSLTRENVAYLDRIYMMARKIGIPIKVDPYMLPATRERERPFNEQSRVSPEDAAYSQLRGIMLEYGHDEYLEHVKWVSSFAKDYISKSPQENVMNCNAGKCMFTINWQGMMRPCVILDKPEANVFSSGFLSAWQNIVRECNSISTCLECCSCQFRLICRTCAASSFYETGSFDGRPEYLCRMSREIVRLCQKITVDE